MSLYIDHIAVYPVKSLSGQKLDQCELSVGKGLPGDRRFALTHGSTRFDPVHPGWAPKGSFLNLARNPKLAELHAEFDLDSQVLTLKRDGRQVAKGPLDQQIGFDLISQFISAFMKNEARGHAKLVEAEGFMFSDSQDPFVSIINLDTVDEFSTVARQELDERRFRGNLMIRGAAAWSETQWVGKEIQIGSEGPRLRVVEPIGRCAATTVNPETGERDVQTLQLLQRAYGHTLFGVYAEVVAPGTVSKGDAITL